MFIMHHYGGLYLDFDVECYKPADDSLVGYQAIFQGAGDEGINNAILASVPGNQLLTTSTKHLHCESDLHIRNIMQYSSLVAGIGLAMFHENCYFAGHPVWLTYAKTMETRSKQGSTAQFDSPMYMTGTLSLTRALIDFVPKPVRPVSGFTGIEYQVLLSFYWLTAILLAAT